MMKNSLLPRGASVLVPLLLLALFAPGRVLAQEGAIAGIVRDSTTGTPLSAAAVEVLAASGASVASGVSDARGAFRFTGLAAGTYAVRITLAGWQTLELAGVTVTPGETTGLTPSLIEFSFNLNPITVTGQKGVLKVIEAPAAVSVVDEVEIQENPSVSVYDHIEMQPGVDLFKTGLQQGYAVARGFNNIFSGSMLSLTDYRIARVPSLRANVLYINPTTNPDLDRIEVVLGPSSALYGPNANNGVLHMITKSPIDDPGATLAVAGGGRASGDGPETGELFHGEGRVALAPSDKFGFKLSGQYFRGDDWFNEEESEQTAAGLAQACLADSQSPACSTFPPIVANDPGQLARVGQRDFDLERWSFDFRADARPSEDFETIFQAGRVEAENTIELTGIGAAQARGWSYTHLQNRTSYKDFFAQLFWNFSNAGDTYILETGQPIVDKSFVLAGQLQNSTAIGARENLIYGIDLIRTVPRTEGTINGVNEDEDEITEIGGYIQSETRLSDQLDLVLAARIDHHSVIEDVVFSPRAGLVFKPAEGHSIRATFNRAFSTPDNNNLFLDLPVRTIPITGPFFYGVRAQGTTDQGFTFSRTNGRPDMKTPFAPLLPGGIPPTTPIPTQTPTLWAIAAGVVSQNPALPPGVGAQLLQIALPSEEQVGIDLRLLNTTTSEFELLERGFDAVEDLPPIQESITNTFEVGYKGLIRNRLLLSTNVWYEKRTDFVGPLRVQTPNVFLNGPELGQYLVPQLTARLAGLGFPLEQAQAVATQVATSMAQIPLGVISPEQATGQSAALMLTYRNFGNVDLWGGEVGGRVLISDEWRFDANLAVVSDETFPQDDGPNIALNAPRFKANAALGYRSERTGLNAEVKYRFVEGFPVNSGVFIGDVEPYHLVDLTLGYRLPGFRDLALQLDVNNLLDDGYVPFVGAPNIERLALVRLVYDVGFGPF